MLALLLVLGIQLSTAPADVEAKPPPQAPALASTPWADYEGESEAEEEELEDRQDWALARFGAPTPAEYHAALEQASTVRALTQKKYPSLAHTSWSLVGPTNVGGRITDLVVDPTTPGTIYTAAAAGGVWKSTNADATPFTFEPAWGDEMVQPVGALAIAPSGTLYAGTGEANPNIPSWPGTGVYKSTDGGQTWANLGLEQSGTIGRIAIDPTNPDRIYVAANGYLFTPGGERGLYRSDDGGATWELVLAGANGNTGAVDVAIHPQNPDRVYAAMWDHRREPCCRALGGVGSGLYRSDDGGETWTRLETITNPGNTELGVNDSLGRIGIALAPSNPDRVYVIATTSNSTGISGAFRGFYWSSDGGDTFTEVPNNTTLANSSGGFGWWFGRIWVDPVNADRVFVAGVPLVLSNNPTAATPTWSTSAGVHVDQHAMAWDPHTPGRVYLGNDGGTYRSNANGATNTWTKAAVEPISQFYTVHVSQQLSDRVVGGTQDNSCLRSWNAAGATTAPLFGTYGGCGDGLQTLIDPTDPNRVYACSQNGSCRRSANAGNTTQAFGATTSQRRNWLTPVVFDPNDPSIIYYAGNIVNRSTNFAQNFTAISPDLTGGPSPDPASTFGTITRVAVAKTNPDVIWAGTDDTRLWRTTTGGGTGPGAWAQITSPLFPSRWVTGIAVDPTNANRVYVTFSGFRNGESDAHVVRTDNGGATWTNITGNLPSAPVNNILIHPNGKNVFVATDVGVFISKTGKSTWYQAGGALPQSPVMDIHLNLAQNLLFAGTHGRGIYRLDINKGRFTAVLEEDG